MIHIPPGFIKAGCQKKKKMLTYFCQTDVVRSLYLWGDFHWGWVLDFILKLHFYNAVGPVLLQSYWSGNLFFVFDALIIHLFIVPGRMLKT